MAHANATSSVIDLSIIITTHAEGILLHKTVASVRRALVPLHKKGATTEIIIHSDNPTPATQDYLRIHKDMLADTTIYTNHFGDLGSSRNFAVKKARGRYITFIDADDLMSKNWLASAYTFLEKHTFGQYIAHSESTVEFGEDNSVVLKHGEIDQATDTLLTVFSNRWNSIIVAPRQLLVDEPYSSNSPGYGYEDWHLNCRFIAKGLHNVLIPKTVIFVRRKEGNSEWLRQKVNRLVLPSNPLFTFSNIRSLASTGQPPTESKGIVAEVLPKSRIQKIKGRTVPLLRRIPLAERVARKAYHTVRPPKKPTLTGETEATKRLPDWLIDEWRDIHSIEKKLFPTNELIRSVPIYDSLVPEHYQTGEAFKKIIDCTTHDTYGYILFVPWLKTGGADLLSIHFVSNLKAAQPDKNIMVVATMPTDSPWASKLPEGIDFIPFGQITDGSSQEVKYRLLEQLIENSGAAYLHILNSELGYDFVTSHEAYVRATNKKIIATSFSQSVDGTGRIFGYSHTHVPKVYEMATAVTTDNQAVADMWASEYGFDPRKIIVQHTPIAIPELPEVSRPNSPDHLRVLWAARLSPEKQPTLVGEIGSLLKGKDVSIDMYGHIDEGFKQNFLKSLPTNVQYKGPYEGFYKMPLADYDAYLYTSLFDGMPITVLEVASAKIPMVSSYVGGVPSFIEHKKSGLLVKDLENAQQYADALLHLKDNPQLLHTYSDKLYDKLVERHSETSYQKQIKKYAAFIGY